MSSYLRIIFLVLMLGVGFFLNGSTKEKAGAALQCDESYPDICLPPGLDISCFDIGFQITVAHDRGTDPYLLDPDFDGIGCEEY